MGATLRRWLSGEQPSNDDDTHLTKRGREEIEEEEDELTSCEQEEEDERDSGEIMLMISLIIMWLPECFLFSRPNIQMLHTRRHLYVWPADIIS